MKPTTTITLTNYTLCLFHSAGIPPGCLLLLIGYELDKNHSQRVHKKWNPNRTFTEKLKPLLKQTINQLKEFDNYLMTVGVSNQNPRSVGLRSRSSSPASLWWRGGASSQQISEYPNPRPNREDSEAFWSPISSAAAFSSQSPA